MVSIAVRINQLNHQLINWLTILASARWTVLFFLLTAFASLAIAYDVTSATLLMSVPFALLVFNLVASLIVHARFRTDIPLLVFHIALLLFVLLLIWARLTYLDGRATLTSGTAFDGKLQMLDKGLLHKVDSKRLHFINNGFSEDFYVGGQGRQKSTYNNVRWQDNDGNWHNGQIGDDHPLLLNGYRIYTTYRRGYSPVFEWQLTSGEQTGFRDIGTVQLSADIDGNFAATNSWVLPHGPEVWVMLENNSPSEHLQRVRNELDSQALRHNLILRINDKRFELEPGDSITLPEGKLTYLRLTTWMGYLITYDSTIPWVMATTVIGIFSLIWFYWRRIFT